MNNTKRLKLLIFILSIFFNTRIICRDYKQNIDSYTFLFLDVPASHGIPTQSELKKVDNINEKAQELQHVCKHINTYLENTTRTEKLQTLGFVATDMILDFATTSASFKALSMLKGPALKTALALHGKTLKKLGPIGNEVAKLAGLAIDKGAKATETLLDIAKHNPELVTAEGSVFKFVENALEKEQKAALGFKEISKEVVKAEKIVKQFNHYGSLEKLKEILVKKNGEAIGKQISGCKKTNRTLPGTEQTAKNFFDKLVGEAGLSDLVIERTTKDGSKLFVANKPGFGSISFRPITDSGPPGIDIKISQFEKVVQKIKFVKDFKC